MSVPGCAGRGREHNTHHLTKGAAVPNKDTPSTAVDASPTTCPETRSLYATRVRQTNEASGGVREAESALVQARADLDACRAGEAKELECLLIEASRAAGGS